MPHKNPGVCPDFADDKGRLFLYGELVDGF